MSKLRLASAHGSFMHSVSVAVAVLTVIGIAFAGGGSESEELSPASLLYADKSVIVPFPPPPTVVVVNASLSDNGDDDPWADTNETVEMRITVYNRTGQDLTGLVARLSTNDPKIACISESTVSVGNLLDRQSRLTAEAFVFMVADVDRPSELEEFSVSFEIEMVSDQFEALPEPQMLTIDLDLNASGGSGLTTFFEGFEDGFGLFTAMHLDENLNPPDGDLDNHEAGLLNSDGYRCQYNDPDWEISNSFGRQFCYLSPNGQPDAFHFGLTEDRAFSGTQSLYYGVFLNEALGFTTPVAQLEAMRTAQPINLSWDQVCSATRTTPCAQDADCPFDETCVEVASELVITHQISQMDHRTISGGFDGQQGVDRAVLHVRVVGDSGEPFGDWIKIRPWVNAYDSQDNSRFTNCSFDPIDDGNTEEEFFDPQDPWRRFGPSSTCFPERVFIHQGDTEVFDPNKIGDASDGPGLEGSTGVGTWIQARFDLRRFRGRSLLVRFVEAGIEVASGITWEDTLVFNPAPGDDGWFIDDVSVTDTLTEPASITADPSDNITIKADWDLDSFGAVCDCAPDDETAWMLPGPVSDLVLSHTGGTSGSTTLSWRGPDVLGGTAVNYDTIGSTVASDFVDVGFCVESNDGSDTSAIDSTTPDPGVAHYFLVRAKHVCGAGPLGETSTGDSRTGIGCP